MGKALGEAFAEARAVYAEVDDALGASLSSVMFEGPEADSILTANAQPALMAVSLAAVRVLEAHAGLDLARDAVFVAGHSLGEYRRSAAAGALSIADTARRLRLRGEAMQAAVRGRRGRDGGAPWRGTRVRRARSRREAAKTAGAVCQVANDNGGGQVVSPARRPPWRGRSRSRRNAAIKRAIVLPVSAPFHCSLMQPAAEAMREALGATRIGSRARPSSQM